MKYNTGLNNISAVPAEELQFVMDFMPQMVWSATADGAAQYFNNVFLKYTGAPPHALQGTGWLSFLHPDDAAYTYIIWQDAFNNGKSYQVEHRIKNREGEYRWFLTRGVAMRDANGIITKWYGTTTDIEDKKQLEQVLEAKVLERTADLAQQKKLINSVLDASFNGIYALKTLRDEKGHIIDFTYIFANKIVADFIGIQEEELTGKSMLEVVPEAKTSGFFKLFCEVLETGKPVRDETFFEAAHMHHWFYYAIVPIDKDTLVVTLQDISEQKKVLFDVEEQRNLLHNIMSNSPTGISVTEVIRNDSGEIEDARTIIANENAQKFTSIPLEILLQKKISEIDPDIFKSPLFEKALETFKTGNPFITQYYFAPGDRWLELSVARMDENRLINIFTDVTDLKKTQLAIEEASARFAAVFNAAQSGMFTSTPVQDDKGEIIDFRFVITNPNFASYVGQTPEVLNGELGSKWFPNYFKNGVFDMFKKTILTGGTYRQDIRYNFDEHDVYLDLKSTKVGEEVLVTFNDFTPLRRAQLQLETYVEELKRSNSNLEEFAYAASHDMKEPIRKIHFFGDRLKGKLAGKLDKEELDLFERMENATRRMVTLIDDLLLYSFITKGATFEKDVDLNKKLELVLEDLELEIQQKNANIHISALPQITGHRRQLQQLFQNLISNALKYCKPNVPPVINISCTTVKGKDISYPLSPSEQNKEFYLIKVEDNGIGFEQKNAECIFNMFTRLHGNSEYKGTGVGLSIAQKVVQNHEGHIWADSEVGKGSVFTIVLPTSITMKAR